MKISLCSILALVAFATFVKAAASPSGKDEFSQTDLSDISGLMIYKGSDNKSPIGFSAVSNGPPLTQHAVYRY